jgi:hypothetical protein
VDRSTGEGAGAGGRPAAERLGDFTTGWRLLPCYTRPPVVPRGAGGTLLGLVSLEDLLKARARNLEAERRLERVHPMHLFFPPRAAREEEEARAAG